jgi:hypothetical protein
MERKPGRSEYSGEQEIPTRGKNLRRKKEVGNSSSDELKPLERRHLVRLHLMEKRKSGRNGGNAHSDRWKG